jgi:hypothetical protein
MTSKQEVWIGKFTEVVSRRIRCKLSSAILIFVFTLKHCGLKKKVSVYCAAIDHMC